MHLRQDSRCRALLYSPEGTAGYMGKVSAYVSAVAPRDSTLASMVFVTSSASTSFTGSSSSPESVRVDADTRLPVRTRSPEATLMICPENLILDQSLTVSGYTFEYVDSWKNQEHQESGTLHGLPVLQRSQHPISPFQVHASDKLMTSLTS